MSGDGLTRKQWDDLIVRASQPIRKTDMNPPVRLGCRVCGGPCTSSYTICKSCADKVFEATGGLSATNIRDYLNKVGPPPPKVDPNPEPVVYAADPVEPGTILQGNPRTITCACGVIYSREITALACAARDHRPLQRKEGDDEKIS